ncbi:hypothetical protein ZB65_004100 [Salmonella enterica subsp. enterica]|nr:hypothetical protein [Salmonella enterica subsp. enterica serovar Richmond]HAK7672429.1 hypothetical protein [Salmonella enterica]
MTVNNMINNGFYAKSETFGGNGRRTPFSAPGRGFGFTVSLPNTATCHFSFSFSDEHLFPAEFFKLLFLLIWYHWRQPLRDAGHLRPATRSEANSFSFTEEDFPLLPPPFRHLPVLQ